MKYNLYNQLEQSIKNFPKKTALIYNKREYSYSELDSLIKKSCNLLTYEYIKKSDRIIICCGNRIETVLTFWATLKLGACVSVISDEQDISSIKYILQDCSAKVLVVRKEILDQLIESGIEDCFLKKIIVTEASENNNYNDLFIDTILFKLGEVSESHTNLSIISEDLAALIYTSGSTGEPKGVTLTHTNMLSALDSLNDYLGNKVEDVFLNILPLSFDYGLYQMIMSFSVGGTMVLEKNLVWPLQLLKAIEQYKVTVLPGVPAIFDLIKKFQSLSKFKLDTVRYITNTGAALMERHVETIKENFKNAKIFSMYGLTECKRCTYLAPEMIDIKPKSVGKAIPNTEISIINDQGELCDDYAIGQLVVRGATVMRGYWNKPEETKKKIREHPVYGGRCLFTGDYGHLDEDGYFYFKGRMDEVIKIRGHKVMPVEIERILFQHGSINEVAIIGVESDSKDPEIIAYIESDKSLTHVELNKFFKSKLQPFQKPSYIKLIKKMPRNTNGKIDKPLLKAMFTDSNHTKESLS